MSYSDDFLNDAGNQKIKAWAMQQMQGQGIPTVNELYSGQKAGIDSAAYNLAGSQASQMASRGLSGSGYDRQGMANVAGQHGSNLASAKQAAAEKVTGMKNDAFSQGTQALNDYNARASEATNADIAKQQQKDNLDQQYRNNNDVWQIIGKFLGG